MELKPHVVLRDAVRHYPEYEAFVSQFGTHVISHKGIELSFYDIQRVFRACFAIENNNELTFPNEDPFKLSRRKKEAIFWNVIQDEKQKDVAERMGITTVSVGQYVEAGFKQVSRIIFEAEVLDD